MQDNIILYETVFTRDNPKVISFEEFLSVGQNYAEIFEKIKATTNKEARNLMKRNELKAASFEDTNILVIDIDRLEDNSELKEKLIQQASEIPYVWIVRETPSGNICLFIQYNPDLLQVAEYWRIYYRVWLNITAQLDINIDFLPEKDRLRYLSNGEIFHRKDNPEIFSDYSTVDVMPYINTNKKTEKKPAKPKTVVEKIMQAIRVSVAVPRGEGTFGSGRAGVEYD